MRRFAVATLGVISCQEAPHASGPDLDVHALPLTRDVLPDLREAVLTAEQTAKLVSLPDNPPVLLFHQVAPGECAPEERYCISRAELRRVLLMLGNAGYTTLSAADFVRWAKQDWIGLPPKPVFITFDDGRLDAYQGADALLEATHSRATMFVITDRPGSNDSYMSWTEIATAQRSGRWDMQLHAHRGHVQLPAGGGWYANELPGESFTTWKARVEGDVSAGISLMARNVPGYRQWLFAVPFGDWGQTSTNDPQIPGALSTFLTSKFGAWFGAPPLDFALLGSVKDKQRLTVLNTHTVDSIYGWLRGQTIKRAKTPAAN